MDLSSLSPSDAVVALRSLPRRFRAVLAPPERDEPGAPPDPDDIAHRPGTDGASALDHARQAARAIDAARMAVHTVFTVDGPAVDLMPLDASAAGTSAGATADQALRELDEATSRMAAEIEHVAADSWGRIGTIAGANGSLTALDIVRRAVDAGVTHLKAAERTLEEARRRPN